MTILSKKSGEWEEPKNLWAKVDGIWRCKNVTGNYGRVIYKASPDSDEKLYVDIKTLKDLNSLGKVKYVYYVREYWSTTISGVNLNSHGDTNVIIGIEIGPDAVKLPDGFMSKCEYLSEPIIIPDSVRWIGHRSFTAYVGEDLNNRGSFNAPVTIGKNVEFIGDQFLSFHPVFNQPIVLPASLKKIGRTTDGSYGTAGNFLSTCYAFNSTITFEGDDTDIGAGFLSGCWSFNKPISLPQNITTIPRDFLYGDSLFSQDLDIPDEVKTIGENFLAGATTFNNTLTLPDGLEKIGGYFLESTAFNQELNLPSSLVSIGEYFLALTNYNKELVVPNTVQHVGSGFLHGVYTSGSGGTLVVNLGNLSPEIFGLDQSGISWSMMSFTTSDGQPTYIKSSQILGIMSFFPDRDEYPYRKILDADKGISDYGYITYWDGNSTTSYKTLYMTSQADWNALGNNSTSSTTTMTVQGVTLTKGGNNAIRSISIGKSVTSLPNYFLYYCVKLRQSSTAVDLRSVRNIGTYFMAYTDVTSTTSLGTLYMPSDGASVGNYFMYHSGYSPSRIKFYGRFTLPSYFMRDLTNCSATIDGLGDLYPMLLSMSSTYRPYVFSAASTSVTAYTRGPMLITSEWYRYSIKDLLPNSTATPYRKIR